MLTVHLVAPAAVDGYAAMQRDLVNDDTVVVMMRPGTPPMEARRLAREAHALGRNKEVVAVVPCSKTSPTEPAVTQEWRELASVVLSVVKARDFETVRAA